MPRLLVFVLSSILVTQMTTPTQAEAAKPRLTGLGASVSYTKSLPAGLSMPSFTIEKKGRYHLCYSVERPDRRAWPVGSLLPAVGVMRDGSLVGSWDFSDFENSEGLTGAVRLAYQGYACTARKRLNKGDLVVPVAEISARDKDMGPAGTEMTFHLRALRKRPTLNLARIVRGTLNPPPGTEENCAAAQTITFDVEVFRAPISLGVGGDGASGGWNGLGDGAEVSVAGIYPVTFHKEPGRTTAIHLCEALHWPDDTWRCTRYVDQVVGCWE